MDPIHSELYQELIIEHGTKPRNFGRFDDPSYQATGFNPLCGDEINLFILEDKDSPAQIIKANFEGKGCAISTASASIMTELLSGKTIIQALNLYADFIACITTQTNNVTSVQSGDSHYNDLIEKLPPKLLSLLGVKNYPARVKCATLAWHALKSALNSVDTNPYT